MRRSIPLVAILLVGGLGPGAALPARTTPAEPGIVAGAPYDVDHDRLVVGLSSPSPLLEIGSDFHGFRILSVGPHGNFVVVEAPHMREAARELGALPGVDYVEPDRRAFVAGSTPNDPLYPQQYGPQQVDAPGAWAYRTGGVDRPVCILDTGVELGHRDLNLTRFGGGWDHVNNQPLPEDTNGHGTHVTGIAAASVDNGIGVAGIGNVTWYHMKVADSTGKAYHSDIAAGIRDCSEAGPTVISMSLGGYSNSMVLRNAIKYAFGEGNLLVAAAGNEGPCADDCIEGYMPASRHEVVAVTCTNQRGQICTYSSNGSAAELAAPGDEILSTSTRSPISYAWKSGTSMSTPHVAGAAALIWSWLPDATNHEIRDILAVMADDGGELDRNSTHGYGVLDMDDVVRPTAPQDLEVRPAGSRAVEVSWSPPRYPGTGDVQAYEVLRGHAGDPLQRIAVVDADASRYVDWGRHQEDPRQFRYAVRAVGAGGPGYPSPPVCRGSNSSVDGAATGASRDACQAGAGRRTSFSLRLHTDTAGSGDVGASGTGDASGRLLAASATGDSTGAVAATLTGDSSGGLAASANGSAQGAGLGVSGTGPAEGLVAVTGTGDARGTLPVSGTGNCSSYGSGEARCFDADPGKADGYWLAAGGEEATCSGHFCSAVSAFGPAAGFVSASLLGDAEGVVAATLAGDADGTVSASGTGAANGSAAASGAGNATGVTAALSGTGDTDAYLLAASGAGDSEASWVAVSGTGQAEGSLAVSGCETVRSEAETGAACQNTDPPAPLP